MRGLENGCTLRSHEPISDALASRLARHVISIHTTYPLLKFTHTQVQLNAAHMPFLRELSVEMRGNRGWWVEHRLLLEVTLKTIAIRFDTTSAAAINSVLAAFSHHRWLASLELLFCTAVLRTASDTARIKGTPPGDPQLCCPCRCHSLRCSRCQRWKHCLSRSAGVVPRIQPSVQSYNQVQELRALKQLAELARNFSEQTLLKLLQMPHQLRWMALPYNARCHITGEVAALLPSVLHLHSFSLAECHPSLLSLDFLARLPTLTELVRGTDMVTALPFRHAMHCYCRC